jgi:hypothetical protein
LALADKNFLEFIPIQAIEWQQDEARRVYLIKEKTRQRWLKGIIAFLKKSQYFHIHLDDFGSAAWLQVDGQQNILAIANRLREQFGQRIEPAEKRTAQFFAQLFHNRFVSWKEVN